MNRNASRVNDDGVPEVAKSQLAAVVSLDVYLWIIDAISSLDLERLRVKRDLNWFGARLESSSRSPTLARLLAHRLDSDLRCHLCLAHCRC